MRPSSMTPAGKDEPREPWLFNQPRSTGGLTHRRICQGPLCGARLAIPAGQKVRCERCGTSADYNAPRTR